MLQLKNITKDYQVGEQQIHALQGISVDFRKSDFVSILGPSGCGKTTLMNIVGGLDKYTSGDLIINGKSTQDFKDNNWDYYRNKKVGFVFQTYNLIPHLNVLGNVELALTLSGVSKEERKKRAKKALEQVGLGDNLKQRPNQLSGGQMQRVAIARALVNSPEILLADEPTGALDTDTSEQIMEILKEISKDKLVIMVTHNPDIAERFSTRLIKMKDGKIISDSAPYLAENDENYVKEAEQLKTEELFDKSKKKKRNSGKSSMSFLTALSISWRNLLTKRGRTILTSIAGSIGIIGIALILAISNGMNIYISKLQADTLSSNPITVTESAFNITEAMNYMNNQSSQEESPEFPVLKKIFVEKAFDMSKIMNKNNISQEYIDYVTNNLDKEWYNDIIYKTGMALNIYGKNTGADVYSKIVTNSSAWQMLLKEEFLTTQYDVLDGKLPSNKNEIVIIVDKTNKVPEETLIALGLKNAEDEITEYPFSDILGKEYKLVDNNLLYTLSGSSYVEKSPLDIDFAASQTLTVTGILRINQYTESGVLSTGIGYTKALYEWLQETNGASDIINFMDSNPNTDPFTGMEYASGTNVTKEEKFMSAYRALGGNASYNEISIYPVSFESKEQIKKVLNDYNNGRAEDDMVKYSDMSELLGSMMSDMVDIISYVLIAFTAISLLVSSIMIGIITYVSVLERTKEIGILRSIGARKKDVTRLFNAETFIIGICSGVLGVLVTYLLSIPINLIINSLVGVSGIANLNIAYAFILIAISVCLTLISGLIPSLKAAKKDPVTALRTE